MPLLLAVVIGSVLAGGAMFSVLLGLAAELLIRGPIASSQEFPISEDTGIVDGAENSAAAPLKAPMPEMKPLTATYKPLLPSRQ